MEREALRVGTEAELMRLALDLGATDAGGPLVPGESALVEVARRLPPSDPGLVAELADQIRSGLDPLGAALLALRPPERRRTVGAFYTPPEIVEPMVTWAMASNPGRLVDPGCGSGRFTAAALRRDLSLQILAIDLDPHATLLTRAAICALGATAGRVVCADYLTCLVPEYQGRTAWVGNPPYVRHHDLSPETKAWAAAAAKQVGQRISGLAGLHALFFLATALKIRSGDVGCFVTSAEWLDVAYGAFVRRLFIDGLGGRALDLVDPRAVPFEDAMTTALIACFEVGHKPSTVALRVVDGPARLRTLESGRRLPSAELRTMSRWSPLFRGGNGSDADSLALGAVARVHRGLATGANDSFILTRERAGALGIERWCRPAVTSAAEILQSDGVVRDSPARRLVLDLPGDFDRASDAALDAYLSEGERRGLPHRYIPSHRRPWWKIGVGPPAPIVATYMARQAPRFALNPDGLALLNIGHGVFPLRQLSEEELAALATSLNAARLSFEGWGRTYHGGLEKFEPREMEALLLPSTLSRG